MGVMHRKVGQSERLVSVAAAAAVVVVDVDFMTHLILSPRPVTKSPGCATSQVAHTLLPLLKKPSVAEHCP